MSIVAICGLVPIRECESVRSASVRRRRDPSGAELVFNGHGLLSSPLKLSQSSPINSKR